MPSPEWRLNRDYFSSSFDSPVRICFFLSVLCLIKPRPIQLTNRCGGARAIKTAVRILEIWRGSKGCDATPLRKHPPTFIILHYILYEFYKTLDCDTSWLGTTNTVRSSPTDRASQCVVQNERNTSILFFLLWLD
jgi:hypothetical protein